MPAAVPFVAAGIAAIGTGYAIYSGERANKANKKARKAQSRLDNLRSVREKRDAIRAARVSYGEAQQAAANQGVSRSSGAQGGQASISSQMQSNISFLNQGGFFADMASNQLGRAATFGNNAQLGSAVASLGMIAFNNSDRIASVFNPSPATATIPAGPTYAQAAPSVPRT